MKERIVRACNALQQATLEESVVSFIQRLNVCITTNGHHFEHLICTIMGPDLSPPGGEFYHWPLCLECDRRHLQSLERLPAEWFAQQASHFTFPKIITLSLFGADTAYLCSPLGAAAQSQPSPSNSEGDNPKPPTSCSENGKAIVSRDTICTETQRGSDWEGSRSSELVRGRKRYLCDETGPGGIYRRPPERTFRSRLGRHDLKLLAINNLDKHVSTIVKFSCQAQLTLRHLPWLLAPAANQISWFEIGAATDMKQNPPPTNGIVWHDSHLRKSGVTQPEIEPESPRWEVSMLTAQPPRRVALLQPCGTMAPEKLRAVTEPPVWKLAPEMRRKILAAPSERLYCWFCMSARTEKRGEKEKRGSIDPDVTSWPMTHSTASQLMPSHPNLPSAFGSTDLLFLATYPPPAGVASRWKEGVSTNIRPEGASGEYYEGNSAVRTTGGGRPWVPHFPQLTPVKTGGTRTSRENIRSLGSRQRENHEKIRRPVALSNTIPTCEHPGVTRPGIEPGSPRGSPVCPALSCQKKNLDTTQDSGFKRADIQ
ncbi:hypothetical protein PR048_017878 [Dryococelus australis]|uniref:Uncharacterized protein n=1 Tax=Dryococelus australis TaxID=614101 RepID=A0ABQ9HAP5_9NEOP|nr:hypothetical protein PR048_017878 [Dryococelus australis]